MFKDNDFQLRHEDELMLSCARTQVNEEIEKKIISLASMDLDWEYLINMVSRHRLRPLLYVNLNSICPKKVPEDVLESLKSYYMANVQKNLMLTGELVKIIEILESNDIKAIPYKGPVLASLAYNNIGLRIINDLDIYVDESNIFKAIEILKLEGYQPHFDLNNISESDFIKTQREYLFEAPEGFILELHWNIQGPHVYFPIEPSWIYEELELIKINNFKISSFSPENLIIILSLHSAKHNWDYLSLLCDISEIVNSQDIKWDEVFKTAEKLCVKRILTINILLINDLFNLEIQDNILTKLYSDNYTLKIIKNIKKLLLVEEKKLKIFEKVFIDLKKREKLKYGILDCWYDLTKPSYADFNDINLPKRLFPLCY
ncbi:MAG: nucleotidyltransferase family protein [Methanobacteriaceae archaeon]|nr:nucleotidyltransferase family protein [Methanobacteriaceae archaeon]